tara:strand:+ start:124 stop:666 length:543 start_codon:yes stop_codon:yes gene_type:complete
MSSSTPTTTSGTSGLSPHTERPFLSPHTEFRQSCVRLEMLIGLAADAARPPQEAGPTSPSGSAVGWACDQAKAFCSKGGDTGWDDEKLKALSAAVISAAPDKWCPCHMRARVLSADEHAAWPVPGTRTREELIEAAMCFTKTAELAWTTGRKASLQRAASACVEKADTLGPLGTGCGLFR